MGIRFSTLWKNYPSSDPCVSDFTNQCAIRVGQCLVDSGVSLQGYSGRFCWHGHGKAHPLAAEELAAWLHRKLFGWLGRTESVDPDRYQGAIAGRTGIIFFKDYYRRDNQTAALGDHIDLWNTNRTTGQWFSWSRGFWEGLGVVSDQNRSSEIQFWGGT